MQNIEDFEAWVKTKGGQKGLVGSFARRFPKEKPISQTAVSNWVTRRVIPLERRPQLKILGWDGPWEWPKEAVQEAREATSDFTSREEHWKLVGRVDTLERRLEDALILIRDLKLKGP